MQGLVHLLRYAKKRLFIPPSPLLQNLYGNFFPLFEMLQNPRPPPSTLKSERNNPKGTWRENGFQSGVHVSINTAPRRIWRNPNPNCIVDYGNFKTEKIR